MTFSSKLAVIVGGAASAAYSDALDLWRDLEGKARGNIAIAGIFLAGAFGFAESISDHVGAFEKVSLGFGVLSLAVAIATAFFSLTLRSLASPLSGSQIEQMGADLLRFSEAEQAEQDERLRRLRLDIATPYNQASDQLRSACRDKAWWIAVSQIALVTAAVGVTATVLLRAFGGTA